MTPHAKVYFNYFDYKTQSDVLCEACGSQANDIHHIHGREARIVIQLIT